jgi:hypothetical protein
MNRKLIFLLSTIEYYYSLLISTLCEGIEWHIQPSATCCRRFYVTHTSFINALFNILCGTYNLLKLLYIYFMRNIQDYKIDFCWFNVIHTSFINVSRYILCGTYKIFKVFRGIFITINLLKKQNIFQEKVHFYYRFFTNFKYIYLWNNV